MGEYRVGWLRKHVIIITCVCVCVWGGGGGGLNKVRGLLTKPDRQRGIN